MPGTEAEVTKFDQLFAAKRGKDEVSQIIFLTRSMVIALLINGVVNIVACPDLSTIQDIKSKKVHMFCVNAAVYSFEMGSQSSYAAKAATVLMD